MKLCKTSKTISMSTKPMFIAKDGKGGKRKKQANKQAKKTERYSPKWKQGHGLSELIPPAQEDGEEEKQWLPEKLRAKFRDRKK